MGRSLDRVRGFDRFLAVANALLRARQDVLCVVAGDPIVRRGLDVAFHNRDYPAHLLATQPPADPERLWFLGAATPAVVAEILGASDLHIAPSRSYPVVRSLLEAMASGCVVLAADTEPHREVMTSDQTGLLIDGEDSMGFCDGRGCPGRPGRIPAARKRGGGFGARAIFTGCVSAPACGTILAAGWRQGITAVNVFFIHDAFPAQFGGLGLELAKRYDWHCSFLVQSLSSCPTPTPEMLKTLEIHRIPLAAEHRSDEGIPWPQIYGHYLEECQKVHDAIRANPRLRPDLVVAHGGRGAPSLFLREVVDCPIVIYCEYYFANRRRDISYRIDLPPAEPAPFFPRCINCADPGDSGRLRRRLFGDGVAEGVVSEAISPQDRGALRWHRHDALPARPGA